ncbi:MAG: hypothetical protein K9H26_00450 [Prolixibacteraceae bacterium]|nr:hypothetical protein [Prolixibacteraceae bacterium]
MKYNFLIKLIVFIVFNFLANTIYSQFQQSFELSVHPGYSQFSTHQENGMSVFGEFVWNNNKFINPSLRVGSSAGFKLVEEGMGAYNVLLHSVSLNAIVDFLNSKSVHNIQLGLGPCLHFEMYSYLLETHNIEGLNRNVNEFVSVGYYYFGIDYFLRYKYQFSEHFQVGLEWSETGLFSAGKVKQSAISLTLTSLIF